MKRCETWSGRHHSDKRVTSGGCLRISGGNLNLDGIAMGPQRELRIRLFLGKGRNPWPDNGR